jgi:hypothetical protein
LDGLKRLGLSKEEYNYYALHCVLDQKHWEGWKNNAVMPLIQADPQKARGIAEGALMRLLAGKRCFEVYAQQLALTDKNVLPFKELQKI